MPSCTRLYRGKTYPRTLIPVWFDEGVGTQTDYREQYSEETWREKTNSGANGIALDEMDTAQEFFAGDVEAKRFRYMLSRHEVKSWIERNGMDEFLHLIEQINQGGSFDALYHAM